MAGFLDGVLLGLDHQLVAFCGHLHRENIQGPHHPAVRFRCAGRTCRLLGAVVWDLWTRRLDIELNGDGGLVESVVEEEDVPGALFSFLEHFPATFFISVIAIILVVIFFITSVDSAALVTDTMANGHEDFNPLGQRIFWAIAIAVITATLLVFSGSGGLDALEQLVVLVGLPFCILAYFQMYALHRALREDASEVPPVRTRSWKKVLPPEEHERRQNEDEHDTTDVVVEPEAADERPVIRDPYLEEHRLIGPRGTLSARTGSAWLRRKQGIEQPPPNGPSQQDDG